MKKVITSALVLSLAIISIVEVAQAQLFNVRKTAEFEMELEESFDNVWQAAVKALIYQKYRIVVSDKEGGIISAERRPGLLDDRTNLPNVELVILNEEEGKVLIIYQYAARRGVLVGTKKSAKKHWDKLSEKIVEILSKNE